MCGTCGCSETQTEEHQYEKSNRSVQLEQRILSRNDTFASKNRSLFNDQKIKTLNLLSSPGAGKTTLLESTLSPLNNQIPCAVIEGDQHTNQDAERIKKTGVPVVQINTGKVCHLEAQMISEVLPKLALPENGILFIENVGNLICPSEFDLGEHLKVVLFSTPEGEDKPIKYPHMFHDADLVLITKTDLLPHLRFDLEKAMEFVRRVNSKARVICLNTYENGDLGFREWCEWLLELNID